MNLLLQIISACATSILTISSTLLEVSVLQSPPWSSSLLENWQVEYYCCKIFSRNKISLKYLHQTKYWIIWWCFSWLLGNPSNSRPWPGLLRVLQELLVWWLERSWCRSQRSWQLIHQGSPVSLVLIVRNNFDNLFIVAVQSKRIQLLQWRMPFNMVQTWWSLMFRLV